MHTVITANPQSSLEKEVKQAGWIMGHLPELGISI